MDKTERELREMLQDRRLVAWPTEEQWNAIWTTANAAGYRGNLSNAIHGIDPELLNPEWVEMMNVNAEDAKMMWAEICVRSSVSPFVEVNTPFTEAQKAEAAFQAEFKALTSKGWTVMSNGPEGIEFQAPKKFLIGMLSTPETRFLQRPGKPRGSAFGAEPPALPESD